MITYSGGEHRINENKEMLFALGMVSCSHAFNNNEQFEYQSTVQLTKTLRFFTSPV